MLTKRKMIRRYYRFYGSVQAVGFRWHARTAAQHYGATGWVRNERGGEVSLELQGSEAQIDRVLQTLERAPWIRIEGINSRTIPVDPDERGFITKDDEW